MLTRSGPLTEIIPLVDLSAQYAAHKDELNQAVAACLARGSFIGGPDHAAFAEEFATWCGGGHVALVGNGTDALTLALIELLGPGNGADEVITVSHTFIATAEAISAAGYKPVLVDVDPNTYLMDLDSLPEVIGPRTRAIVPVHLYGQMVAMDRLMEVARAHSLLVVEDAAQAHGARWQGKGPGLWGDAATFSFYPGKNLGAWGDGGAVLCQDEKLAHRILHTANHGRATKYVHDTVGRNSRLDGLQAAVLRVKLRHLQAWNSARQEVASWYNEFIGDCGDIRVQLTQPDAEHVYHLYVVQIEDRDRVHAFLSGAGIRAGIHYPTSVHEQPAYAHLGYQPEHLPNTRAITRRVLSLPMYPELSRSQVEHVSHSLIEAISL